MTIHRMPSKQRCGILSRRTKRAEKETGPECRGNGIKWIVSSIKWIELRNIAKGVRHEPVIARVYYRPFCRRWLYFDRHLNDGSTRSGNLFRSEESNLGSFYCIGLSERQFGSHGMSRRFLTAHFACAVRRNQSACRYIVSKSGGRVDNITDWALDQFRKHYQPGRGKKESRSPKKRFSITSTACCMIRFTARNTH